MDLKTFYNDLKSEKDRLDSGVNNVIQTPLNTKLGSAEWKRKASDCAKELSNDCAKHIILDIYCRVIPFDNDFVQGNQGMMKADIDNMLASKGMSATQYLQSCANNTKAPMCEYVLKMCNLIGNQYLEKAKEKLKDANEKGLNIPNPEKPDIETDEEVSNQLVDIKDDPSYQTVMDKLKEQTESQIIEDITKILTDKKKDKDMAFNPKGATATTESTTFIAMDSIQSRFMKENVDCTPIMDDIMGLAIRESTLNIIDECFKMPKSDIASFKSNMKYYKGSVITESAISSLIEAAKSTEEVEKVVNDADKKKNEEIDSKLKASDIVNAEKETKKQTRLEREEGL